MPLARRDSTWVWKSGAARVEGAVAAVRSSRERSFILVSTL